MSADAEVEKRDEFLRHLARMPHEGLRYWSRITEGERMIVVTYMTIYYDADFASGFLQFARGTKRPDLSVYVTNDPTLTAEKLKQAGYRLLRDDGLQKTWVNAFGKQVWVLPPPKTYPASAPGSADPSATPREHPDVEEARLYADDLTTEQNELLRRSRELSALKPKLPPDEYARRRAQWMDDYEEWEENRDTVLNTTIPSMTGTLTKKEAEAKQKEIDRLKGLSTTPKDFFPPLP
jgi:hypothetical protein